MHDHGDWFHEDAHDDPLGAIKGILVGLVLGSAVWGLILLAVWFML